MPKYSLEDELIEVSLPNGRKVKVNAQNLRDYQDNIRRANNPTVLPEVTVSAKKVDNRKKISLKDINWDASSPEAQARIQASKDKEGHWYDYGVKNFKDTFGVNPRSVADWIPGVGDALALGDVISALKDKKYGEAALVAGMFVLPNVIEKPIKGLYKYGRKAVRNYKKIRNYNSRYNQNMNDYDNFLENLERDYLQKHGDIEGTIRERALGVKDALLAANKDIRGLYATMDDDFYDYVEKLYKDNSNGVADMFIEAPEYVYYAWKEGLDPKSKETAKKFIQRQSTSMRSVHSLSPEQAEIAGTIAYGRRPAGMSGGDQMNTSGGLYTSNSGNIKGGIDEDKIANRFAVPISEAGEGDMMLLRTDFGVDPNLSPLEQIRQFKDKSIDYEILNAPRYVERTTPKPTISLAKKRQFKSAGIDIDDRIIPKPDNVKVENIKHLDNNILAVQEPYLGAKTTFERALLTNKKQAKVADIIERKHVVNTKSRENRWTPVEMDYADGLFLPYRPSYDLRNLIKYSKLKHAAAPRQHNEQTRQYAVQLGEHFKNRREKVGNLVDKRNEAKHKIRKIENTTKNIGKSGIIIGGIGGLGYGATRMTISMKNNNDNEYYDNMTNEEFNKYYNETIKYLDEDYDSRELKNLKRYKANRDYRNKNKRSLED